jgi:hypothetical protein
LAFKKRSFGKKKIQIFLLSVSSEEKLLNLQTKKKKKKKKKKKQKFHNSAQKRKASLDYCPCPRSSEFSS